MEEEEEEGFEAPFSRSFPFALPFDAPPFATAFFARMSRSISSIVRVSRLSLLSLINSFGLLAFKRSLTEPPFAVEETEEEEAERAREEDGVGFEEEDLGLADAVDAEVEGLGEGWEEEVEARGESLDGEGRDEPPPFAFCARMSAKAPLEDPSSSRNRSAFFLSAFSARVRPVAVSFSLPFEPLFVLFELEGAFLGLDESSDCGRVETRISPPREGKEKSEELCSPCSRSARGDPPTHPRPVRASSSPP